MVIQRLYCLIIFCPLTLTNSYYVVVQFSKKTGDYASLSLTDIKVLALTLQLEWERVGRDHLRSEPATVILGSF